VSYDDALADRVRVLLEDADVTEKRMFGGLAFLLDGHMAVAASGQGGLLVRVDPAETERLLTETGAEPMVMRGREMKGWVRLPHAEVADESALEEWVQRGIRFAGTLPPKG
jgi:TfoX/Sxy family transcriptional regulator of competence genes